MAHKKVVATISGEYGTAKVVKISTTFSTEYYVHTPSGRIEGSFDSLDKALERAQKRAGS